MNRAMGALLLTAMFLATPHAALCDNAESHLKKAGVKLGKHDYDGAIAECTKAIELKPDYEAYYFRGSIKEQAKDWDGAIADYSKAIELKPDEYITYFTRGQLKERRGDWSGAIEDYTKQVELDPAATSYDWRGRARYAKGDIDGAIADYTKAIELGPNDSGYHDERGDARYAKGDFEGALADINSELQRELTNNPLTDPCHGKPSCAFVPTILNIMGMRKQLPAIPYPLSAGDLEGITRDNLKATQLKADLALAYAENGYLKDHYFAQFDGAIADCTRAIELEPNYAFAYGERASAKTDRPRPQT